MLGIEGGGSLLIVTGTPFSTATLSAFQKIFQNALPSSLGEAQNERPVPASSSVPNHSNCLPQKSKPVVVTEPLAKPVKPTSAS
jgi:hypothetical protein